MQIAEQHILGLRSGLHQSPEAVGIFDLFDRLVPLRQRHVGLGDMMLADDAADEDRLRLGRRAYAKAKKSYSMRLPGASSVPPACSSSFPITAVAVTYPRGLKVTELRLPLASVNHARLQDTIIIVCANREAHGIRHLHRKQMVGARHRPSWYRCRVGRESSPAVRGAASPAL